MKRSQKHGLLEFIGRMWMKTLYKPILGYFMEIINAQLTKIICFYSLIQNSNVFFVQTFNDTELQASMRSNKIIRKLIKTIGSNLINIVLMAVIIPNIRQRPTVLTHT